MAPSKTLSEVSVIIPKGFSAMQIANKLYEEGLIKNTLAFKIYVQFTGQSSDIPAGEYTLPTNLDLGQLLSEIAKGPTEVWVTIPEGLRREQIAERFADGLKKTGTDRGDFITEFMENSKGKEGYLFPDTYLFPKTATAEKVVSVLTSTFDQKFKENESKIAASEYPKGDVVIMASILERETKSVEEKPIVAGILWKRLEADWPLQVDAAVQYAVASQACKVDVDCDWWPELTRDDLGINSAFNTYKYTDLPPSPIANPGLTSILAAASPSDSDYWYYIHDPKGVIHYATTLGEHNANIAKFLGK